MLKVVLILLILLYVKYVLLVAFYFLSALASLYYRYDNLFTKIINRIYLRLEPGIFMEGGMRWLIYHIGLLPSVSLRKLLYKGLGIRMGKRVVIHFRTEFRAPQNCIIGDGTIIGDNAILDARSGLTLGRNVNISSNVSIYTLQHNYKDPNFLCNQDRDMAVSIGDRVWLGANVVVLPGVTIGEGAVCCAGAVVTKNVEPYAVVAGVPAKKIAERPENLKYEFSGKSCWFY